MNEIESVHRANASYEFNQNISNLIEPFFKKIREGAIDEVRNYLIAHPQLVNTVDRSGWCALTAAPSQNLEMIKLLLKHGADVNAKSAQGRTPLHVISMESRFEDLKAFIESGVSNGEVNATDETTLEVPLIGRNKFEDQPPQEGEVEEAAKIVELLIQQTRADVTATNSQGQTPLHVAAYCGYPEVVKILIDNGALKGARDYGNRTPLDMAILSLLEIRSKRISIHDLGREWCDMAGTFNQIIQFLMEGESDQIMSNAINNIRMVDQQDVGIKTADKEAVRTVLSVRYLFKREVSIPPLGASLLPKYPL